MNYCSELRYICGSPSLALTCQEWQIRRSGRYSPLNKTIDQHEYCMLHWTYRIPIRNQAFSPRPRRADPCPIEIDNFLICSSRNVIPNRRSARLKSIFDQRSQQTLRTAQNHSRSKWVEILNVCWPVYGSVTSGAKTRIDLHYEVTDSESDQISQPSIISE